MTESRVEPRADRRIADAELALNIFEIAARADERLEEIELIRAELMEPTKGERAFDPSPAGCAFEASHAERLRTDGAPGNHRICHEAKMLANLIESQAKLRDM